MIKFDQKKLEARVQNLKTKLSTIVALVTMLAGRYFSFLIGSVIGAMAFFIGWFGGKQYALIHAAESVPITRADFVRTNGQNKYRGTVAGLDATRVRGAKSTNRGNNGKNKTGQLLAGLIYYPHAQNAKVITNSDNVNKPDKILSSDLKADKSKTREDFMNHALDTKLGYNARATRGLGADLTSLISANTNTVKAREFKQADITEIYSLKLLQDQQAKCYWLVIRLSSIPQFKLKGGSDGLYRILIRNARYDSKITFPDNLAAAPIVSLQWQDQSVQAHNDVELAIKLKSNGYVAGARCESTADGMNYLKLQIIDLSNNTTAVNPDLHHWYSDELTVNNDGYQVQSSAVSESKTNDANDQLSQRIFSVKRSRVQMNAEDQSALAMQQVDELLERNDLAQAISKLYGMFGEFGARHDIVTMLAALLLETGQIKEATSVLDQGLRKVPNDAILNELKAKALIAEGAYDKAREHLSKMINLTDLRQAELAILALLGMVDYQLNQFEESVLIYHELTRREPNKAAWWLGLGMALEGFQQLKAAREAYQHGLNVDGVPIEVRHSLLERLQQISKKR